MLSFTGTLKVFVALEPCDLRRGHNGLLALVSEKLQEDFRSGAPFVFSNRRHRLAQDALLGRNGALAFEQTTGEGHVLMAAHH